MSVIGQRIGRFRIEALLGSGGMGEVYQGYDEILGREVALKVAGDKQRLTPLEKTRFFREARVLSHLDHPNICRIYDLVERPQSDVLVLEYIKGPTLRQAMKDGMGERRKFEIALDILRVLEVAHSENILHRDLKPDNVMINEDGVLKVLDFGLARSVHDQDLVPIQMAKPGEKPPVRRNIPQNATTLPLTPNGAVTESSDDDSLPSEDEHTRTTFGSIVGTLWYMSPEQAQTMPANTSCDMYSLGVVLQELFSERPAYSKKLSMPALLYKVSQADTRPLSDVAPNMDPDLATLIKDLLKLNPEARPTATEARQRLQFIADKPKRRQKRRTWTLAALLSLIVVVAAGWSLYQTLVPPTFIAPNEKARLVVLPFRNVTGDTEQDWVEWGLRSMVASYLDNAGNLESVGEGNVRAAMQNLRIFESEGPRQEALQQLSRSLNAKVVVSATVDKVDDGFQMRYSVYNFQGAGLHRSIVADNLARAGRFLSEEVNKLLLGENKAHLDDEFSDSDLANQLYGLGLQAYIVDGPEQAADYFRVCLDIDPAFDWARLRLAKAMEGIGQPETSRELTLAVYNRLQPNQESMRRFCLISLAALAARRTDWERCETLLNEAMDLAKRLDRPVILGQTYREAGELAIRRRNYDQAQRYYEQARQLFESAGSLTDLAAIISDLGYLADERNRLDLAESYYLESIEISKELGYKYQVASTMNNLGVIYWHREQWQDAEDTYNAAGENFEQLGMVDGLAMTRGNIGLIRAMQGKYKGAEQMLLEALNIYRQANNQQGVANISFNLIELYLSYLETPAEAGPYIEEALTLYGNDPDALFLKALYHYKLDQLDQAVTVLEEAQSIAAAENNQEWIEEHAEYVTTFRKASSQGTRLPLP